MAAVYLGGKARKLRMKWGRQREGWEESSHRCPSTQRNYSGHLGGKAGNLLLLPPFLG